MIGAAVDKDGAGIGGDAEEPGMAERDQPRLADQHVEAEGKDRIEQDLCCDVDIVGVADPERHRRQHD